MSDPDPLMTKCTDEDCKHSYKAHQHVKKGVVSESECNYVSCRCRRFKV